MWTAQDRERYKDEGRRYPSDLSDAEWALVRPLIETYPTLTKDRREMVNGCLYLAAEGSPPEPVAALAAPVLSEAYGFS
jgi:putative transposase